MIPALTLTAVTSLLLAAVLWMSRCRHAWTVVSDREFKSPMEELPVGGKYWLEDLKWMLRHTYIAIVKCDKCGAIKTFKERS